MCGVLLFTVESRRERENLFDSVSREEKEAVRRIADMLIDVVGKRKM